jgi:hypothetical protein
MRRWEVGVRSGEVEVRSEEKCAHVVLGQGMSESKWSSKNNLFIFSRSDFIVPLPMEGVPRKASCARQGGEAERSF